jgi:quinoprotein glucose dehydrogenase
LLWTFHTVPQPGEFGSDTWDKPEAYAANAWAGIALDEKRGIAFITTASPKPNFNGVRHRGQNLFANCVIALDAGTGKRLWHFQEIRHDIWDLDISAPPNLATITREGRRVDVVTATTKIGNTLLLDRTSGKPIFPFRLRRAPTSDVAGEQTWPYQPDPELPENFSKLEFTAADLTTRTPEAAARRPPRAQNSRSKTLRDIVRLLPRDQSFGDRPVSAVARVAASVERGGDHPTNSRGKERDAGKPATERGGLEGAGGFSSSARPPGGGGGG